MESNDNNCDNNESVRDIDSVATDNDDDDALSFVQIVPNRSPPIPVPFNPNVVLRGHYNNQHYQHHRMNTLLSSNSDFGLSYDVQSSSEFDWRRSTDSGTQFDDDRIIDADEEEEEEDDDDDEECSRRRISTGAESGYYGSPFSNINNGSRIIISGLTPMTTTDDISTTTMFALDDLDMSGVVASCRRSSNENNMHRVFPLFVSNMNTTTTERVSLQLPSTSTDDGATTAAAATTTAVTMRHLPNLPPPPMTLTISPLKVDAKTAEEQQQRPPRPSFYERCENTFRSIGTQTSESEFIGHPDDGGDEHDAMRDEEGLYETYDTDDAFLPNVASSYNGEESRPTSLPDVIPMSREQRAGNERHRAHSVSLPLTPVVRAGRFLALIATQFDDEHRPNANRQQNGPSTHSASYPGDEDNNNGGFLNFLRASLKSRRRPRAQSASAALP